MYRVVLPINMEFVLFMRLVSWHCKYYEVVLLS